MFKISIYVYSNPSKDSFKVSGSFRNFLQIASFCPSEFATKCIVAMVIDMVNCKTLCEIRLWKFFGPCCRLALYITFNFNYRRSSFLHITVPIVMTSKWWKWDLQKALLFHRPENVCLTKVKETDPKRTSEWGAKRRIGIRSLEQGSNSN